MMKQLKKGPQHNATNWLCRLGQRCTTCGRRSDRMVQELHVLIAKARYRRSIKGTKPIFKEERTVYLPKASIHY